MIRLWTFLLVVGFASSTYAEARLLKQIKNSKTNEVITANCELFEGQECSKIVVDYFNPQTAKRILLYSLDKNKDDINIAEDVMYSMKKDLMMKGRYQAFATYRKVCEMGQGRFSDVSGCIVKTAFATGIILASTLSAGTFSAAMPAVALGGNVSTMALNDMSIAQFFLYYPALAVDLVRLVTVYPVKKIIHSIQKRTLKRKIIPVLEELADEIDSPSKKDQLENEWLLEGGNYRVSTLKNRHFKKVLKFFLFSENSHNDSNSRFERYQ